MPIHSNVAFRKRKIAVSGALDERAKKMARREGPLGVIRPQIAPALVHLGSELNVISNAIMGDALALAFRRSGKPVLDRKPRQRRARSVMLSPRTCAQFPAVGARS